MESLSEDHVRFSDRLLFLFVGGIACSALFSRYNERLNLAFLGWIGFFKDWLRCPNAAKSGQGSSQGGGASLANADAGSDCKRGSSGLKRF